MSAKFAHYAVAGLYATDDDLAVAFQWAAYVKSRTVRDALESLIVRTYSRGRARSGFAHYRVMEGYARYATAVRTYMAEHGCSLDDAQRAVPVVTFRYR
jgi:hypothetical protein